MKTTPSLVWFLLCVGESIEVDEKEIYLYSMCTEIVRGKIKSFDEEDVE